MLEIVEDHRGDTYRTVYTVRFEGAVYVLHAFRKKSPKGIKPTFPFCAVIANLRIVAAINIHAGLNAIKTLRRSLPNG